MSDDRETFRFLGCGGAAAACAAAVPPLVAAVTSDPRVAKPTVAIAMLGLCSGLAWIAVAATWQRSREQWSISTLIVTVVMVSFAGLVARHPERNWDYRVTYELPAQQLASGVNPYENGETTNPPTWAQLTGAVAFALREHALRDAGPDAVWFWVFYTYQTFQLALLAALLGLLYRVAREAGRPPLPALALTGVALVICSPLQESLALNQLNLLVLVLTMLAVLLGGRHPFVAGLVAGFGGAVKIYPFGVTLLWLLRRRLRALAATVVAATAIAFAGWSGWSLYVRYLQEFERPALVRDASLHSIASNVTRAVAGAAPGDQSWTAGVSLVLWLGMDLTLVGWIVWRQRSGSGSPWEIVAALPLLFPLGWVHHYLLVLPLGVARFSADGSPSRTSALGGLLALVLPAFDTFPLGLARPLGTILLVAGQAVARAEVQA